MSMVSLSDGTTEFLRKRKIGDLDPILAGLKQIPVGEREKIIIDLVHVFGFSKTDLTREFQLLCK